MPVYQRSRRLSLPEKQEVNKQIQEWLEQGIIRNSSSEYASPYCANKLPDAKVYTLLDLKNGFFHVAVDEESRKFTSFVVPDGQYEFNKVPFGLSTSPSVFQRYVYSISRHLMNKSIVITYMDNLIIPSEDEEEGHIVENGTIRPSPAKTLAVKRFPVPTNVKRVQSFLGLTSYFRKFIPEYSKIAKPLIDLLRKRPPIHHGPRSDRCIRET
ncbi:retrovirus-related Pol polyprotein from transposon 297 [Caerostris extrusa]|uniref:Retrovirus-related Pol polyprotein from transposon 297 n=1 Tax=Caerostris extrusa TaxID=172846 RepID=A0AAV4VHQ7_CAEEX|nr:retrovirus-related Pol polyprotein from transposon 297 [Caerostris extrusa]